jgi:hypothetical protein
MTRGRRSLALVAAALSMVALAACGGSTVADDVPSNVPALLPVLTNNRLDNAGPAAPSGSTAASALTGAAST